MADDDPWDLSTGNPYTGPVTGFTPQMASAAQAMGNPWGDTSSITGTGGGGGILDTISNALDKLRGGGGLGAGSKAGQQQSLPPAAQLGSMAPGATSTYHQGSPTSGLAYNVHDLASLMKWKGLLGV